METQKLYVFDAKEEIPLIIQQLIPEIQHSVLLLKGKVGVGKTTFTQYFCEAMGCQDPVTSPTYSIVNPYEYPGGTIYHIDLYRLNNIEEAIEIGLDEYIHSGELCIIEWPDIYENEIDVPCHTLSFHQENFSRTLTFN